jgi:hypothetical protein
LYAAALHLLAGAVSGSMFKIQTLVMLCGIVLAEAFVLALAHSPSVGLFALANLVTIQIGYLAGAYGYRILKRAGYTSGTSAREVRSRGYADN